jgi:YteA family regulatory protein
MAQNLDLDHFRQKLEQERRRMQHQMRVIEARQDRDQSETLGELSDYDDHPADVATETFEREKDRALRENAREIVERIDASLRKMEAGTYGLCDICGQVIPAGRLEAVPYATLCVKCQADVEGP